MRDKVKIQKTASIIGDSIKCQIRQKDGICTKGNQCKNCDLVISKYEVTEAGQYFLDSIKNMIKG